MDSQSFLESQQKKTWQSLAIREKLYAYMIQICLQTTNSKVMWVTKTAI